MTDSESPYAEHEQIARTPRQRIAERGYLGAGVQANYVMEQLAYQWPWWRRFLWNRFRITPPGWLNATGEEFTVFQPHVYPDLAPRPKLTCPVCGKQLETDSGRDQHMAAKHPDYKAS